MKADKQIPGSDEFRSIIEDSVAAAFAAQNKPLQLSTESVASLDWSIRKLTEKLSAMETDQKEEPKGDPKKEDGEQAEQTNSESLKEAVEQLSQRFAMFEQHMQQEMPVTHVECTGAASDNAFQGI